MVPLRAELHALLRGRIESLKLNKAADDSCPGDLPNVGVATVAGCVLRGQGAEPRRACAIATADHRP